MFDRLISPVSSLVFGGLLFFFVMTLGKRVRSGVKMWWQPKAVEGGQGISWKSLSGSRATFPSAHDCYF